MKAKISDADFERIWNKDGARGIVEATGVAMANAYKRRRGWEKKYGRRLSAPGVGTTQYKIEEHPQRQFIEIENGTILIGSDGHYWPGEASTAHRAFVKFAKDMKPKAVIFNGDAFDGASISRHPPIGWASQPTVRQELEVCQDRLDEIARAAPRGCRKIWSLGNHDSRFETRIATVAPELAKVPGTSLRDHFPIWEPCWSVWINDDVVVKHRFKNGLHAPHNNTLWSGRTMVTGHLHSAKVQPISDYNGTRFGVDTGCLAGPYGAQFYSYTEDAPVNWRSGFCVLTFKDGALLMPELVLKWDSEHVQFRGELIKV